MATKAAFRLERATPADMREMVDLQYACFPPEVIDIFMGGSSPEDISRLCESYTKHMRENPSDVWIKVTDTETGKIIAASDWRVYVNGAPQQADDEPPAWLEGAALERSKKITGQFNEARRRANPGPYVRESRVVVFSFLISC